MSDSAHTLAGLGITWDDDGRPDGFQVGKSAALLDWQHKREERAFADQAEHMLATEVVQCQATICCITAAGSRQDPPRCRERATRYARGRFLCWVHAVAVRDVETVDGRGAPTQGMIGVTGGRGTACGKWRSRRRARTGAAHAA